MDTQRADNISCYGYYKETTPNIDRIADEGAIFLNNISPGIWTLPSHASLFTGRYVSGHGADANCEFLPVEFPTMAEILGKLGYQTIGFSNNGWVSRKTGVARGFHEYYLVSRRVGEGKIVEWFYVDEEHFKEMGEQDKGSLKTVNAVISWLRRRWSRNKPFFIFINFIEPHGPYWPPEPFRSRFLPSDVGEEEAKSIAKLNSVEECIDIRVGALKLSEEEWRIEKALYDGCTATLDDRIGKLFSYLDEKDLVDETILIITSDHGDVQGEHPPHVEHHLCAYDELVRVPLIVRYPKAVPRHVKVKYITQTHDILPTLLDILGIKDEKYWRTLQGVSLLPSIAENKPVRENALIEYNKSVQQFFLIWRRHPDFDIRCFNYKIKALRNLKYKYIWYSNGIDELYDLENDPGEKRNIAKEQPDIVKKMRSSMERMLLSIDIVDYGDLPALPRRIDSFGKIAEQVHERLKAWGFYRDIKPAQLPREEDTII
jgi:arylsulfatase A-like enzyme